MHASASLDRLPTAEKSRCAIVPSISVGVAITLHRRCSKVFRQRRKRRNGKFDASSPQVAGRPSGFEFAALVLLRVACNCRISAECRVYFVDTMLR